MDIRVVYLILVSSFIAPNPANAHYKMCCPSGHGTCSPSCLWSGIHGSAASEDPAIHYCDYYLGRESRQGYEMKMQACLPCRHLHPSQAVSFAAQWLILRAAHRRIAPPRQPLERRNTSYHHDSSSWAPRQEIVSVL